MSRLLRKRAIALLLMLVMIITLIPTAEVSAKTKKNVPVLKESSATLYIKGKFKSEYQVNLENLSSDATVSYKSSDESTVTVNENGVLSPVKKGTASIEVNVNQNNKNYKLALDCTVKKATLKFTADKAKKRTADNPAELTVGKSLRTGIKLNGKYVSVFSSANSENYNVMARIYDATTGKQLTAKRYAGKNKYIDISETGILTAKKAGKYYIVFTSYPSGCENTIYVNVTKAKPTPTPEPTEEPTAVPTAEPTAVPTANPTVVPTSNPTAVPTANPTAEPTATPTEAPAGSFNVNFAFTKDSAYLGESALENGGAVLPENGTYQAGTLINTFPIPEMWGGIFLGWYYDADKQNPVGINDEVKDNMTLYADIIEGDGAELVETPVYYTVTLEPENVSDFTFDIKGYSEGIIESFIDAADETEVSYTVNGETIVPSLEQGKTYTITLKSDGINSNEAYFVVNGEAQLPSVIMLNIITEKEEVMNLSLADDMIFIPYNELSEVQGEMFEGLFIASAGEEGGTVEGNRYSGSFCYEGSEKLEVGSKVAIYDGIRPDKRGLDTMGADGDGEIIYVTIVTVAGSTYGYKNADADEVIQYTEILPVAVSSDKDNDASNHSITVDADVFDYSDSKYSELGLDADTIVNEGDFILFYRNTFENAEFVSYAKITSVTIGTDEYTVSYVDSTEEEVKTSMEIYTKQNRDIKLSDEEIADIENEIQKQAYASGFIDEASEYLAALALETDGFKEMSEDLDFDLESYDIRLTDASVSDDTDGMSLMGANVKAKVKKTDVEVSVTPNQKLSHYSNKKGLKAGLKLSITLEITSDKVEKGHIEIDIVAFFEEEVFIDLTTSSKTIWKYKWIFPYIYDYSITANLDFGTFTSVGITATIKTVETPEKLEVPENVTWDVNKQKKTAEGIVDIGKQMKKLMDNNAMFGGSSGNNATAADSLSKKYADFIKKSGDSWITIVEKKIFEVEGGIDPLHILCYSLTCNFVVKVNLYLTMGVTFETGTAKRYTFNFSLKDKKATTNVVNLVDDYLQVEFYVFGTAGLRVGFEFEVGVGLLSTKLDSIGVTAEVGAYAQLWGYFYLKYKQSVNSAKQKIVEKNYSGALYIEIGIYLEIHFKAQLFSSKKLTYEPTLYEHQWKLVGFGEQKNIRDFSTNNRSAAYAHTFELVDNKELTVPKNLFTMNYLDLKEGSTGTVNYDDNTESKFTITFTNKKFSYDAKNNKIKVNISATDNSIREETDMTITFKGNSLAFTSSPIALKIKVIWTNPANTRKISFNSNGGSAVNPIATKVGAAIKAPGNPVKAGYVFDGWYSDSNCTQKFTFPSAMPNYFVSPGTVGITVYAKWKPAKDTRFWVNYYLEKTDGTYYLYSRVASNGETGSKPDDKPFRKDITGATYYKSVVSAIGPEGNSSVDLYYKLNEYTVTFTYGSKKDGTDNTKDVVVKGKYGTLIDVPQFAVKGYLFAGYPGIGLDRNGRTPISGNVTYEAAWSPAYNTEYKVEIYFEELDGSYTYFGDRLQSGETDSIPDFSRITRNIYCNIFQYDLNKEKSISYPIAADGSTVMKVYYDLARYTATFSWGEYADEKHQDIVIENIRYGSVIETPEMEVPGYEVYQFGCIGNTIQPGSITVRKDENYTAYWITKKDTPFKVEYYLQKPDGTYDLEGTWDKHGETLTTPDPNDLALSSSYYVEYLPKAHYYLNAGECELSPITPDGEAVMKVYYSLDFYTLSFTYGEFREVAGGYNNDVNISGFYGAEVDVPEFEKLGYVHTGYKELPEGTKTVKIDGNATYNATWELADAPYVYEIYVQNAEDDEYAESVRISKIGKAFETINVNAEKYPETDDKYVFERIEFENVWEGEPFVSAYGDSVIKYYYKRNSYELYFYNGDEYLGRSGYSRWGKKIGEPYIVIPEKKGYEFDGWYLTREGADELDPELRFDFDSAVMPAEDTCLYAGYAPNNDTQYTVWHLGQSAENDDLFEILDEEKLTGTTDSLVTGTYKSYPHYSAYTDYKDTAMSLKVNGDGSTTLWLYYKLDTVQVTFDANGGTLGIDGATKTFRYGQTFAASLPSRENFRFTGWLDATTGETFSAGTPLTDNVSLKAAWEEITPETPQVKYYVYHIIEDFTGTHGEPIIEEKYGYAGDPVIHGDNIEVDSFADRNLLVKDGIFFGGSQLDADSMGDGFDTDAYYRNPVIIEGAIIEAFYHREYYRLTWNLGDYVPNNEYTQNLDEEYGMYVFYGTPIVKPEFTAVEGYKFVYAPEVPATMPTNALEINITREPIKYTVKFDGNGATSGSQESQTAVYGTAGELPGCGYEKEGYVFAGWALKKDATEEEVLQAKYLNLTTIDGAEVTLYAIWKQN